MFKSIPPAFVLFAFFGTLFAQLPPTIHRIAPVDSAVDTTNRFANTLVPSLNAEHGMAFAPNGNGLMLPGSPLLNSQPLRVELMAKIDNREPYNILVAHEPKSSPRHWELFSMAGSGTLTLYMPGNNPDHLRSDINVADGQWRHIALEFKNNNAKLFCDGNVIASMPLNRPDSPTPDNTVFAVGSLVEGGNSCTGALDNLRVFGANDALLLQCDFELANDSSKIQNVPKLSDSLKALCEAYSIDTGGLAFKVGGTLGALCGNVISVRSDLIDRLFPTSGQQIEPAVKPGEQPPKGIPKLDGGKDDLQAGIKEYKLTQIDPEAYRPGVFSYWGEMYIDLMNQIEGKTVLPKGAAEQVYDKHALVQPDEKHPTEIVLRRTGALLGLLKAQHSDCWNDPPSGLRLLEKDWKRMVAGVAAKKAGELTPSDYFTACALRRQVMFANPDAASVGRILFLARGNYAGSRLTNAFNSDRMGGHFATQNYGFNTIHGGGIFTIDDWRKKTPKIKNLIKDRKVVPGAEGRLAGRELDYGSFFCPRLDYNGQTVYFSHNGSQEHRWIWTPDTSWNLFKMEIDGNDIVQLTDGSYNDFDPCPMPDGRVVFISERRGGFIRCFDEYAWLRVTTYVMHSMKSDGSDIYPISFFETSEWQPSVDNNGMILFTRWDYTDRENCLGSNFWTCNPDGRNPRAPQGNYPLPWHTLAHNPLASIHGNTMPLKELDDYDKSKPLSELVQDASFLIGKKHGDHRFGHCPDAPSALPMTEMQIKAIPDSHRYIFTAAPHHGETFGSLCILDLREKNDYHMNQVRRITPYIPFPESESSGRSQYRYGSPWALNEDVYLCNSWEDLVILDRFGNEELLCEREILPIGYDPRVRLTEPVPVRQRTVPPIIPQQTAQGEDYAGYDQKSTIGALNVNISDIPLPKERLAKNLRVFQVIVKPNPWMNKPDIGYAPENTPRIPLGTVPIEDDGSFHFEAPPNKQLLFQTLDENNMAIQTMRAVAFVHPGEQLVCTGCHENPQEAVPFRETAKAFQRAPSKLQPEIGLIEPITFYRTVQPVFEKSCVGCHAEQGKGPQKMGFNEMKPYVFFFAGGMLGATMHSGEGGGSRSIPGSIGAANSRLGTVLFDENHREVVSEEDKRRIIVWLDANAPRLGAFVNEEAQIRGELVWPVLDCDHASGKHD